MNDQNRLNIALCIKDSLDRLRVYVERTWIHVCKHRNRTTVEDGVAGRYKRKRGSNDFVSRLYSRCEKCDMECRSAAVSCYRVVHSNVFSKFSLEFGGLGSHGYHPGLQHSHNPRLLLLTNQWPSVVYRFHPFTNLSSRQSVRALSIKPLPHSISRPRLSSMGTNLPPSSFDCSAFSRTRTTS